MGVIDKPIEKEVISEKDRLKEEALRFVNSIRIKEGFDPIYELVPGKRGKPERCVISNSLMKDSLLSLVITGTRTVQIKDNDHLYMAPPIIIKFIYFYDCKKLFPELEEV